jgi:signal transduction histidine kinase/ligand-binding sensor domain-containing protein
MRLYFFIFCLLTTKFLFSQNKVQHYTTFNGLPHDVTYGVFQDSKGYIWIGTDDGLVKYNGKEFKVFSMNEGFRSSYIIGITENDEGLKVIATWGGGIHLIKNDSVIIPKIKNDEITKLQEIYTINGKYYAPAHGQSYFYKYDFSTGQLEKHTKFIKKISNKEYEIVDRLNGEKTLVNISNFKGRMYAHFEVRYRESMSNFNGVYRIDNNKLILIFPELKDKFISVIGSLNRELSYFGSKNAIYVYKDNQILKKYEIQLDNNYVTKAFFGKNTNEIIVLASNNKGVKRSYLYNIESKKTTDLSSLYKIQSSISDILKDNESNLWLTTFGDGVYCISVPDNVLNFPFQKHLENKTIIDIKSDINGNYLILTNEQLFIVSKKSKELQSIIDLKGLGKSIHVSNDTIYVSSSVSEEITIHKNRIKEIRASKLFQNKENELVAIRQSRLQFYKENKFIQINNKTLFSDVIFEDDFLWIASNSGMYKYSLIENKFDKLNDERINKLIKRNDTIYYATSDEIKAVYNNKSQLLINKKVIEDYLNTFFFDHQGQLWIGTQKGVLVYKQDVLKKITSNTLLSSSYISAIFEDYENNIWLGGNKGITILDNSNIQRLENPPIINVFQKNKKFLIDVISYNRANVTNIQYKLNDGSWKTLIANEFEYKNFLQGAYKIIFRARKQDSDWSYSEEYEFVIKTAWYKKRWGISLLILFPSIILLLGINRQLKKVKKRNITLQNEIDKRERLEKELVHVKDNIAQDFHDDLGNKLARISIFSNLLSEDESSLTNTNKDLVKQIASDAGYVYKGTKDFIFSLKTESDYLEGLITYLSDFSEEYLKQFDIILKIDKSITKNVKLPYYWSKQLIFIFKEALTNAVKHSSCSKIELHFIYNDNLLTMSCIDNGIGFDKTQLKRKNGLINLKKRAEKINSVLIIKSSNNKGTEITFKGKTTLNV